VTDTVDVSSYYLFVCYYFLFWFGSGWCGVVEIPCRIVCLFYGTTLAWAWGLGSGSGSEAGWLGTVWLGLDWLGGWVAGCFGADNICLSLCHSLLWMMISFSLFPFYVMWHGKHETVGWLAGG
jgi:hypothetical protein